MTERLEEFRNEAKDVVRKACRVALRAAGFIPDDCTRESSEGMKGKECHWTESGGFLKC